MSRSSKPEQAAYQRSYYARKRQDPGWVARERCRQKAWRDAAKPYLKDQMLRWKFGLPVGQYAALLEAQGGRCAICKEEPNGKRLAVDHCHASGRIRGLLCDRCNRALGQFKESVGVLKNAVKYLRKYAKGAEDGQK